MTGCLLQPTKASILLSIGSRAYGKPCHLDFFSSVPFLPAEGGRRTAAACLPSGLAGCSPGIGMHVAPAETAVASLSTTCLSLLPAPVVVSSHAVCLVLSDTQSSIHSMAHHGSAGQWGMCNPRSTPRCPPGGHAPQKAWLSRPWLRHVSESREHGLSDNRSGRPGTHSRPRSQAESPLLDLHWHTAAKCWFTQLKHGTLRCDSGKGICLSTEQLPSPIASAGHL